MSTQALLDATTWVGGFDFTGTMNQLTLNGEHEALDATVFGSAARRRKAGLQDVSAQLTGFWDGAENAVDQEVFATVGGAAQAATHTPNGTAGEVAYFYEASEFTYSMFGEVGQLPPYTLSLSGSSGNAQPGLIRGALAAAKGNVSTTGDFGSAVNLGAGSAGEYLYAVLHEFTAGTTLTVKIESDDAEAFSDPSDVTSATIGPVTTAGGTFMTRVDASAFTDGWYRFNATAVTGTFNVAAAVGIK
jgi:hypothetical protein